MNSAAPDEPGRVLTSRDPEPPPGTLVLDDCGAAWRRDEDEGYWLRADHPEYDPESWTKIAGNYGPVTVLEYGDDPEEDRMADVATVSVKVADVEPFRTLVNGVAAAAKLFGKLTDAELGSLPEDFRDGIRALRGAVEGYGLASPVVAAQVEGMPRTYGQIIIEWPSPQPGQDGTPRPLAAWRCAILDAETGRPVNTAERLMIPAVTTDVRGFITAELTMFADDDGMPVLFPEEYPGRPGSAKVYLDGDGKIRTGTFPFLVTEMRVRQPDTPAITYSVLGAGEPPDGEEGEGRERA